MFCIALLLFSCISHALIASNETNPSCISFTLKILTDKTMINCGTTTVPINSLNDKLSGDSSVAELDTEIRERFFSNERGGLYLGPDLDRTKMLIKELYKEDNLEARVYGYPYISRQLRIRELTGKKMTINEKKMPKHLRI